MKVRLTGTGMRPLLVHNVRLDARVERLQRDLKDARLEHKQDIASVSERVDKLAEQLERHGIRESAT